MTNIQTEGIILNATPYQDHHHITTLFTAKLGVARLFVRGTNRSRHHSHALVTPLTRGDFLLASGKNSLFRLKDGVITHPYLSFRESAPRLQVACAMARALLATQYPLKPAPALYQLLTRYFDQLAHSSSPKQLLSSYYLKLIKHEGLLATEATCGECGQEGERIYWSQHGTFCKEHALHESRSLQKEEWLLIQKMAKARNFKEIEEIESAPSIERKVEDFFHSLQR